MPPSDDPPDPVTGPHPDPASPPAPTPYPSEPHDERPFDFPWPPREGESLIETWGRTWHGAALTPRRFFAAMPRDGSLGAAILYYLSIGVPVAGAELFWRMVGVGGLPDEAVEAGVLAAWSPLVDFLVSPVVLLLSLFLSAGVVHAMLRLFGGASGGFTLTARVFAFAYSPQVLGVVPVIGSIAGFVWMVVVAIVGVREAHHTSTGKAAAAILIPLAIGIAFMMIAALIAATGSLLDLPV